MTALLLVTPSEGSPADAPPYGVHLGSATGVGFACTSSRRSTLAAEPDKLINVNIPLFELEPRRSLGQGCCARVDVELSTADARGLSEVAKALSDPVRLQIVDVLRRQAGEVCVCDLQPHFGISQPTLSHHLKKLREAGLVGVVRRGQWAYYYVVAGALDPFSAWLEQ
jgi:ArsR family transcriptional regulator